MTTIYELADNFSPNGVTLTFVTGSESTTIAQEDTSDKLWIVYDGGNATAGYKIRALWSTSPYHTTWTSQEYVIYAGVLEDDIAAVVAFEGQIGVLWSNETNTPPGCETCNNFGFRFHYNGDTETTWQDVEWLLDTPASPSGGMVR